MKARKKNNAQYSNVNTLGIKRSYDTKSSMHLDFRRGAQCVPPVCVGVLLGSDGQGASKQPILNTSETAVPPSFAL